MREPLLILLLIIFSGCSILGSGEDDDGPPRTIVFSSNHEGSYQIYSMREDGNGVKQLTDGEYSSINPAWSPDGKRIAYATYQGKYGGETLWVMDADGSNKKPLIANPRTGRPQLGDHPSWSPDGTKIAFDLCLTCERGGNNYDIFVADLQSGVIDTLTTHFSVDREPTWSPDGRQIAFTTKRDYYDADTLRTREDIYLYHLEEEFIQRVTETGYARGTVWNKDGTNIIFSSRNASHGLFLVNLKNKEISKVAENLSSQFILTPINWSIKDRILFTAMDYPKSSFYILDKTNQKTEKISFNSTELQGVDWYPNKDIK